MDKSYVTMEQHKCLVCCKDFNTNAILMDTQLRNRFDFHTVTGWGLCPEHKDKYDEGYIAVIGIDESKSQKYYGEHGDEPETIKPDGAYRTGRVAHVRKSAWAKIFDVPAPDGPIVFAEDAVLDRLQVLMRGAQ